MNHKEMMQALIAGETLIVNGEGTNNYKIHLCPQTQAISDSNNNIISWLPGPLYEVSVVSRTININGFEVPEPLRIKPKKDTYYFKPALNNPQSPIRYRWRDDSQDHYNLNAGLVHLTKEAAVLHGIALLSFMKQK